MEWYEKDSHVALQTISDAILFTWLISSYLERDTYLDHVKPGIKPDISN